MPASAAYKNSSISPNKKPGGVAVTPKASRPPSQMRSEFQKSRFQNQRLEQPTNQNEQEQPNPRANRGSFGMAQAGEKRAPSQMKSNLARSRHRIFLRQQQEAELNPLPAQTPPRPPALPEPQAEEQSEEQQAAQENSEEPTQEQSLQNSMNQAMDSNASRGSRLNSGIAAAKQFHAMKADTAAQAQPSQQAAAKVIKQLIPKAAIAILNSISTVLELGTAGIGLIFTILIRFITLGWYNVEMIYGGWIMKGKHKIVGPLTWDPIPWPFPKDPSKNAMGKMILVLLSDITFILMLIIVFTILLMIVLMAANAISIVASPLSAVTDTIKDVIKATAP